MIPVKQSKNDDLKRWRGGEYSNVLKDFDFFPSLRKNHFKFGCSTLPSTLAAISAEDDAIQAV